MSATTTATMIDVALALSGGPVQNDYAAPLHAALLGRLPWLDDEPGCAVHPLRHVTQIDGRICVGAHSRLVLRVPTARATECAALTGHRLDIDAPLRVGAARPRPLLAFPTLYSSIVVTGDRGEGDFLATIRRTIDQWDPRCQVIVGRAATRDVPGAALAGFSVMLHGIDTTVSLRAQIEGVGGYRTYGCGVFVPHRSADAVVA